MKKQMKQMMLLTLAAALLFGLCMTSAMAEGDGYAVSMTYRYATSGNNYNNWETRYYDTLRDALNDAGLEYRDQLSEEEQAAFTWYQSPLIQLFEDVTENTDTVTELDASVTIDLHGHTLTLSGDYAIEGDGWIGVDSAIPGVINSSINIGVGMGAWTGDTWNYTGGSVTGFIGVDGGTINISGGAFSNLFVNNGGDGDIACTISGDAWIESLEYVVYLDENGNIMEGCHDCHLYLLGGYYTVDPAEFLWGATGGDPFDQSAYVTYDESAVEAYSGQNDWAADGEAYPWRIKPGEKCLHPNAVTAFNWEGHWLYCPDCGQGVEGTFEEHFEDWRNNKYKDIQTVRVTVPGMEQTAEIPANIAMGVGNTVTFIGEDKTFTYLPDNSGNISCMDDETNSLYIPGGFTASPGDPGPEVPNRYSVMIPGAEMWMSVEYEDCGYGVLDMFGGHGDKTKIWGDKWFAAEGETVTFGVNPQAGFRCSVVVRSGETVIPYTPTGNFGEYAFTMPAGNVKMEVAAEPLPRLVLPAGTLTIEESAFEGCGAYFIVLPDGCTSIGAYAFKDCPNLEAVLIPATVTEIDATAFDGCKEVCIYGEDGSRARAYSYEHNNTYFFTIEKLGE